MVTRRSLAIGKLTRRPSTESSGATALAGGADFSRGWGHGHPSRTPLRQVGGGMAVAVGW